MSTNPILYLGQSSVQIGIELDRLCSKERLRVPGSVFADTRPPYGDHRGIDIMRLNMPTLFAYPSEGSENVESVVDQLFRSLESCDNPTGVSIVADISSGVGSSLSSALIMDIKDHLPHLHLTSVLSLPSEETIQNISVLNGLLTLQTSLKHADGVMLRGVDDAMSMVSETYASPTLQDAQLMIAADLYCALGPRFLRTSSLDYGAGDDDDNEGGDVYGNRQSHDLFGLDDSVFASQLNTSSSSNRMYASDSSVSDRSNSGNDAGLFCWPLNTCSSNNKLIDVRSSLWRFHQRNQHTLRKGGLGSKAAGGARATPGMTGATRAENYNPLRAMAANMHALHTTSSHFIETIDAADLVATYPVSPVIRAANIGSMFMESELHSAGQVNQFRFGIAPGNQIFSSTDVAVLLQWACPGMTFPGSMGRSSYRDKYSGQTMQVKSKQKQQHIIGMNNRVPMRSINESSSSLSASSSSFQDRRHKYEAKNNIDPYRRSSKHGNSNDKDDVPEVAAMSFSSPYAYKTLTRIHNKCVQLYRKRAYIHRYEEVGIHPQDFYECLNYISDVMTVD